MKPIPPQPGSAQNDLTHFVGRATTSRLASRKLGNGVNLLLNDPRRLGKTYWLRHFVASTDDYLAVFIDYEGVSTREEFMLRTVEALRKTAGLGKNFGRLLTALFENVEVGAGPLKVRIAVQQQGAARLLESTLKAAAESASRPVLICMDEVPVSILAIARNEGPEAARELLQTLRALRQSEGRIRWIIAGSVGFHHVLVECGTTEGDINDLVNLPLGPLPEGEATELAERLLLGIERTSSDGAVGRMVELTGGIPILLHQIAATLDGGSGLVTTTEVDTAFEDFIDDEDEFRGFVHLVTRLDAYYGTDVALAQAILDSTLSRTNDLMEVGALGLDQPDNPRLETVLTKLAGDHYLERRGTRVRWRYPVLQYIWARRRRVWERP